MRRDTRKSSGMRLYNAADPAADGPVDQRGALFDRLGSIPSGATTADARLPIAS